MMNEITKGIDELGVLLAGTRRMRTGMVRSSRCRKPAARPAQQRDLAAGDGRGARGLVWAIENPNNGVTEPRTWISNE
jgi:homospermidine synthase